MHTLRAYHPRSIVALADNSTSEGIIYEMAGMRRDGELPVDFMYVAGKHRIAKSAQNSKASAGRDQRLPRIYDAGKVRWCLDVELPTETA